MGLQFGCDKCQKMHIGKRQNEDICPTITIDSWEIETVKENGEIGSQGCLHWKRINE